MTERCGVLLLFAALLAPPCGAQKWHDQITQYVQSSITTKDGLPQNTVNAMTQTAGGYLWFATEEGFVRFDGRSAVVFDAAHNRELKDNFINTVAAGRDGGLWVGTRSGLLHYKHGAFQSYLDTKSPVNALAEGRDGTLWAGRTDGLYAIRGNLAQHYTERDGLPGTIVNAITQATDGTVWLGTDKGIASVKGGAIRAFGTADGIAAEDVTVLAAGRDGSVWAATHSALLRWDGSRFSPVALAGMPRGVVTGLAAGANGTLWVGFDHQGIGSIHEGRFTAYTARLGLPSDDVSTLFLDREEHLWVGFAHDGAVELRNGIFSSFGKPEGLSDDMVWSVMEARDGSMWVGTSGYGLNHLEKDGNIRVYTKRDGLPEGSIYALLEGHDGSIWIGAEHGKLSRLRDGRITVMPDFGGNSDLNSILEDKNGDLWLSYYQENGVMRLHDGKVQRYSVPGLADCIALAPDGSLWVGSDRGGVSHLLPDGRVKTYTMADGLLGDFVQSIYVDKNGVVWAGTSPGGLSRIQDGRITTYSAKQGLFDLTVGAMVEDEVGYLWISCNRGIFKIAKKELDDYAAGRIKSVHSIAYSQMDGLRSIECNFATSSAVERGRDGRLWFATTAGVASVDPAHSQPVTGRPSPLIEEVTFHGKQVPFDSGVELGPGAGDFAILYTAPDFSAPERIHFRYRLDPFDKDWVDAGKRREAFYTNLPPGNYTFRLQAAHGEQDWVATEVPVRLLPHFWETLWFKILCGFLLLAAAVGIVGLRIFLLVRRTIELEDTVSRRTAELKQAVRVAEAARRELQVQAAKDSLTQLWNRGAIFEMLEKEIDRAQRSGDPVTVLMLDVDHFKSINDTYGHLAGDGVLRAIAETITGHIRNHDFAGRYGGEEFVIVLPGCTLAAGVARAEDIRHAVAAARVTAERAALVVTCSIGVACTSSAERLEVEKLIQRADEALYAAKKAGRNCVRPGSAELGLTARVDAKEASA